MMSPIGPYISRYELSQLPDDGKRYELVKGGLLVSPAAKPKHQRCVLQVARVLQQAEEAGYGQVYTVPLDVILDDHNVVEPDVLFVRTNRLNIVPSPTSKGHPIW